MKVLAHKKLVILFVLALACLCALFVQIFPFSFDSELGTRAQVESVSSATDASNTEGISYQVKNSAGWYRASAEKPAGSKKAAFGIKMGRAVVYAGSKRSIYDISFEVNVAGSGWQKGSWDKSGTWCTFSCDADKVMQGMRIEADKALLKTGYRVYYRVYAQGFGWLGWARQGQKSGSKGNGVSICKIQVVISKKIPGSAKRRYITHPSVSYQIKDTVSGWSERKLSKQVAGATSQGAPIEYLKITASSHGYSGTYVADVFAGAVKYRVRSDKESQSTWSEWVKGPEKAGRAGKVIYAVKIKLTKAFAKKYDIYYRLFCGTSGWLGWAKDGQIAGTGNVSSPVQAIKVCICAKGAKAPQAKTKPYSTKKPILASGSLIAHLAASLAGSAAPSKRIKMPSWLMKSYTVGGHTDVDGRNVNPQTCKEYKGSVYEIYDNYFTVNSIVAKNNYPWLFTCSCNGAICTVIRATVDKKFPITTPSDQWDYCASSKDWKLVGIVGQDGGLSDLCQPGDILLYADADNYGTKNKHLVAADSTADHTSHGMIYVGNEIARMYFPYTKANVYEGGWLSRRYPDLTVHSEDGVGDKRMRVFRYVRSGHKDTNIDPYDYL